jgi:drug/metabolite transporter (DMT)-like permease
VVIALSLAVALTYGAGDFFGGLASRRVASLTVVVWSQLVGLVVLLALLPLLGGTPTPSDLMWGSLCGVVGGAAVAMLYRALAIGVMGVVSPLTAVLAATIPVIFAVLRGERPAALAVAGIVCALGAVVLVSRSPAAPDAPLARSSVQSLFPPGILAALGSGVAFGAFFILLAQTHGAAGLWPLLATRITSLTLLVAYAIATRQSLRISRAGSRTIAACGALDMAANALYVIASHRGALSIVAVISSLYPATTVALAWILLKERLVAIQWGGVALALAGVVAIAYASG